MNGKTLLISAMIASAIAASPDAFAQTSGGASDTPTDHHPAETKAPEQSGGPGGQAQGSPMGPGMMQQPGMMGPGMMGRGQMGPGMMGGGMMHPGMMMRHHGHHAMMGHHGSMMGTGAYGRRIYLSADDVKRIVDGQLAWRGLKRLKVGTVKVVNNGTVAADIVTKEGSLAVRLHVDRHTGRAVIAE